MEVTTDLHFAKRGHFAFLHLRLFCFLKKMENVVLVQRRDEMILVTSLEHLVFWLMEQNQPALLFTGRFEMYV